MNNTKTLTLLMICLLILPACGPEVADTSVPATIPASRTPTQDHDLPTATETSTTAPTQDRALPTATETSAATSTQAVYGAIARQHLVVLSEEIGPRVVGSPEEIEAAEYIEAAFEECGYEIQVQPFSFTTEDDEELDSANVIAVKPGSSSKEIIVGAHYDSTDDGEGVDDNASGVAALLEVAEMLQDVQTPYTIRFIAFGAEEQDMDGSRYYVDQMDESDVQNTVGMINLDSLIAGDIAYVYGDAGAGSIRDWILERALETGFDLEARTAEELDMPDGSPCDCADYGPFQEAGVPFAYFEATNWDLGEEDGMTQVDPNWGGEGEIRHTEYDTVDYIDSTFPGRIDHHLNLFVTLLYDTLTQFRAPN